MSPMTNESNTESSNPELVSSQSDVALSSIDTESLALSQDSDTLDIWSQLPVRKYTDERTGKNKWQCNDCGSSFTDWNLTKALHHVARQRSNDIKMCPKIIRDEEVRNYQSFYQNYRNKVDCRKRKHSALNSFQDDNINKALTRQNSNKKRKLSKQGFHANISPRSIAFNEKQSQLCKTNNQSLITTESDDENVLSSSSASKEQKSKSFYPLFSTESRENDEKARMAIADFIIGCGLPFSIADHPKFRYMCKIMRNSSNKFSFPNRNIISTDLMDALYESNREKYIEKLLIKAESFGISLLGDGATVKRMPLINIIASGVYCPVAVLAISDCTNHMAEGGTKDSKFISNDLFLPHFKKIDPNKNIIDLIAFDGAANVQKAASIICAQYTKCTAIHGGEHVVSLVCGGICKLPVISELIKINKFFYRFFMLHHMPHSMLLSESKKHNDGKPIMFIRASDTRMGGHIISLARTYRLKKTLDSVVTNSQFMTNSMGKKGVKSKIISLVQSKSFWNHVLVCLKCMFPLLKLLRLCDKKEPAMDRLYYYVRQTDSSLKDSKECINDIQKEFIAKDPRMKSEYYHIAVVKNDIVVENEFDDEYEHSDDESDDETGNTRKGGDKEDLGSLVLQHWEKRRPRLVHSYAITAWMLSPIPEVMEDAKNYSSEHHNIVDSLIEKLFNDDEEYNINQLKDLFWQEYTDFSTKVGQFAKTYIWTSTAINKGKSFEWHSMYSLKFTKILGRLACRVTSKIIGIGSAERNWGDVKHLKSGKRSHLLGKTLEKQATIYGTSCVEIAKISRDLKNNYNYQQQNLFFDDGDLAEILNISIQELQDACPRRRTFNAWVEPWESSTTEKCDTLEKRLLEKYGGLKFRDDDHDEILTVNPRHCCYKDGKPPFPSGECGTVLYAMKEEMDIDDVLAQEPWELQVTIEQIIEYGDPNVKIITTKSGEASKSPRKKLRSNKC